MGRKKKRPTPPGHDVDLLERLRFEAEYLGRTISSKDWEAAGNQRFWFPELDHNALRQKIAKASCDAMQASLRALGKGSS